LCQQMNTMLLPGLKVDQDQLTVTAQAAEVGTLEEIITLEKPASKKCEARFNAKYLLEPLQVMEKIKLFFALTDQAGQPFTSRKRKKNITCTWSARSVRWVRRVSIVYAEIFVFAEFQKLPAPRI